jgi:protein involved in polysaccharide export with SLBB domain
MRFATRSLWPVAALVTLMAAVAAGQGTPPATPAAPRQDTVTAPRQDTVAPPPPQAASAAPDTLPPPRAPGDSTIRPTGTLRPGDILQLKVYRDSELTGSYLIEANGFVQIPGLGTIRAAGLRPDQVTQAMVEAMRAKGFREPELAVRPMIRLSVLGQVHTPMLYSIDPGLSLLQLITLAGGPGERADLRHTRVIRDGKAYVVDLEAALHGSPSGRIALYSNDVVFVPAKSGLTKENVTFIVALTTAGLTLLTTALLLSHYR